jgi:hypothetical protein
MAEVSSSARVRCPQSSRHQPPAAPAGQQGPKDTDARSTTGGRQSRAPVISMFGITAGRDGSVPGNVTA